METIIEQDKDSRESSMKLSVVVPMYNEESVLKEYFQQLEAVLEPCGLDYEIICVNDGSTDNTLEELSKHRSRNPAIRIIDLTRRFGKEAALTAGLAHASGDIVIPMDADLQDPPELIPKMIEKWQEGYDVVYATRKARKEAIPKRATALLFYRLFNRMADIELPVNAGDYRLMTRAVVDAVSRLPERARFMKGLFAWVGFRQASVEYERPERSSGRTKWNYWSLWNFALDGITSFTTIPLRVWTYLGLLVWAGSIVLIIYFFFNYLFMGGNLPGFYPIVMLILFFGGLQVMTLGIMGEYIGRIHEEVKLRPIYLIRETMGFEKTNGED